MKLAIIGSRDLDIKNTNVIIEYIMSKQFTEIVSGGATGADQIAKQFAIEMKIKYVEFAANWVQLKRAAGPIRNKQIAEYSDYCLAFINKPLIESRGTANCLLQFKKLNKPFEVIELYD